jgi:uncharacterized protein (TIGR02118 family)
VVKVVIAVWQPDAPALDQLRGDGVVVRQALDDQGRYGAGDPFDVLVTAPVDDPGPIEPARLGARVWAWTVEERRPRIGDEECAVTMVALMRRRPDLSHEDFAGHWTERHTPLALAHHAGLYDYTQNLVIDALTPEADEIDGVAELGFRTRTDFETRFYDSEDGRRAIGEDVRRFMAGPGPDTTLLAPLLPSFGVGSSP